MPVCVQSLWAVHISDANVLTADWLLGGFAVAALLAFLGAWRIRDEEIPRVALLTAAFFVASLVHVRVGPTSVHLLLNGLLGLVLGARSGLAIPVGLFLQAALIGHGGFTTLGVNSCVLTLPALFAWQLFGLLQRVPWVRHSWSRTILVAASVLLWILSLCYSLALLGSNGPSSSFYFNVDGASRLTFHPLTLAAALIVAVVAAWLERRMENGPEFPIGLLVGEATVLMTMLLNCLVLIWGGREDWHTVALLTFVAHLPIAALEGIVVGFTVGFLVRVKPEMLRWAGLEKSECPADALP